MTNTNTSTLVCQPPEVLGPDVRVAEMGTGTLIIPDVHQQIFKVKQILAHASARYTITRTVWLGDWFDSWHNSIEDVFHTVEFLRERMETHAQDAFILGNHDMQYIYPEFEWLQCSGNTRYTYAQVSPFREMFRERFVLTTYADGYRCSHAGFHPSLWVRQIGTRCREVLDRLCAGERPAMLEAGATRGGRPMSVGGCTWLDWDHEFPEMGIPGVAQIVGHTQHDRPMWKDENLCLDTGLDHYAVITAGRLKIHALTERIQ